LIGGQRETDHVGVPHADDGVDGEDAEEEEVDPLEGELDELDVLLGQMRR
jgi:hypothetical protein